MSDSSQGERWWQASDLKWYPPQSASGDGGGGGRSWVLPTVLVVVVALIAAGVTFLVAGGGDEAAAESVALEPVASAGADPFTDSIAVNEIAEFPDTVNAVITDTIAELPTDDTTGTLVAVGTTPGLYGGTTDNTSCDAAALSEFLTDPANADKAEAWAEVAGVAVEDIATFISELAPTVLTLDTRVTNHGYRNGRATPRQSVLQAGTAVLVDALGIPRARCSCGNPLTEPTQVDLGTATTTGTQWATYTVDTTATPQAAPEPQTDLTLLDTTTADTYQAPVGQTATWVATAGDHFGNSDGGGGIWTSSDGTAWEQTLDTPERLNAVAYGAGLFVAVGEAGTAVDESGVVYTSTDGRTWSDPISVPLRLADVAYGNGRWVAISYNGAGGSYDSGTPVLTSPDGSAWTESAPAPTEPLGIGDSLTFTSGRFMLMGLSCGNGRNSPGCEPWYLLESEDGSTWAESAATPRDAVGFIGEAIVLGSSDDQLAIVGTDDAFLLEDSTWTAASTSPTGFVPQSLSGSGGSWFSVGGTDYNSPSSSMWTSPDLSSWTQVGTIDASLTDIAVSGTPSASATPATPPPEEPAPTGQIDFSSPLLNAYEQALEMSRQGDGPARLARDVARLSATTGIEWTEEMVIALAASACNDWGSPEEPLTPEERAEWARQVAPVLSIPLEAAEVAVADRFETYPPCG